MLREFQEEISRLKKQLEGKGGVPGKKKKRRRRRGDGSGGPGDEDDEDDDGEEVDPEKAAELYRQEQQQKLDKEKQDIINDQSMIAEVIIITLNAKTIYITEISIRKNSICFKN